MSKRMDPKGRRVGQAGGWKVSGILPWGQRCRAGPAYLGPLCALLGFVTSSTGHGALGLAGHGLPFPSFVPLPSQLPLRNQCQCSSLGQ